MIVISTNMVERGTKSREAIGLLARLRPRSIISTSISRPVASVIGLLQRVFLALASIPRILVGRRCWIDRRGSRGIAKISQTESGMYAEMSVNSELAMVT